MNDTGTLVRPFPHLVRVLSVAQPLAEGHGHRQGGGGGAAAHLGPHPLSDLRGRQAGTLWLCGGVCRVFRVGVPAQLMRRVIAVSVAFRREVANRHCN